VSDQEKLPNTLAVGESHESECLIEADGKTFCSVKTRLLAGPPFPSEIAERMVACWNVCCGIPAADIEELLRPGNEKCIESLKTSIEAMACASRMYGWAARRRVELTVEVAKRFGIDPQKLTELGSICGNAMQNLGDDDAYRAIDSTFREERMKHRLDGQLDDHPSAG
jgi:hypothetical protein